MQNSGSKKHALLGRQISYPYPDAYPDEYTEDEFPEFTPVIYIMGSTGSISSSTLSEYFSESTNSCGIPYGMVGGCQESRTETKSIIPLESYSTAYYTTVDSIGRTTMLPNIPPTTTDFETTLSLIRATAPSTVQATASPEPLATMQLPSEPGTAVSIREGASMLLLIATPALLAWLC